MSSSTPPRPAGKGSRLNLGTTRGHNPGLQGLPCVQSPNCFVNNGAVKCFLTTVMTTGAWPQFHRFGQKRVSLSLFFFLLTFLPSSSHSNRHGDGQIFLCIFGHIHEDSSEKRSRKDIMRAELISSCFNFIGFFPNYNNNLHIL